jgi:chemotaxis protein histidine kinase CheA
MLWKACFMDDVLRELLTETSESLDTVDNQLVCFEQEPNNTKILDNIFRLVHTIKGTCGFLGLPRLEALAHAAETPAACIASKVSSWSSSMSIASSKSCPKPCWLPGFELRSQRPIGRRPK